MIGFDRDTLFALNIAMEYHDIARRDPVTAPAAFGVATIMIQEMLHINLRAAALLLDVALTARAEHRWH